MWSNKHIDMTGIRVGNIVVLKRAEDFISPTFEKYVQYICQCDCGHEFKVVARYLKRKTDKPRSCYLCNNRMKKSEPMQ